MILQSLAGLPAFPIGPLGGLPLPSRWTLRFGAPIDTGGLGPEAAQDAAAVARLNAATRDRLQSLLGESRQAGDEDEDFGLADTDDLLGSVKLQKKAVDAFYLAINARD